MSNDLIKANPLLKTIGTDEAYTLALAEMEAIPSGVAEEIRSEMTACVRAYDKGDGATHRLLKRYMGDLISRDAYLLMYASTLQTLDLTPTDGASVRSVAEYLATLAPLRGKCIAQWISEKSQSMSDILKFGRLLCGNAVKLDGWNAAIDRLTEADVENLRLDTNSRGKIASASSQAIITRIALPVQARKPQITDGTQANRIVKTYDNLDHQAKSELVSIREFDGIPAELHAEYTTILETIRHGFAARMKSGGKLSAFEFYHSLLETVQKACAPPEPKPEPAPKKKLKK